MIPRTLEPEVMETEADARDYDAMDHSAVNRAFAADFLSYLPPPGPILDVGTGTAQILVYADGDNSIAVFPGANMDIGAPEIAQAAQAIGRASLVYGQLEMAAAAVLAAFTVARAQGVRTVLNASPAAGVSPALLAVTDVLVVNAVEAAQLMALAQDGPVAGGEADDRGLVLAGDRLLLAARVAAVAR